MERFEGMSNKALVIAALIFIIVVGGLVYLFSGGSEGSAPKQEEKKVTVTDKGALRSVRLVVGGRIVADEDYRGYVVEVTPMKRTLNVAKGYAQETLAFNEYGNNAKAYEEFVYALQAAGFDKERKVKDEDADIRGVCPNGKRYEFEIYENDRLLRRTWSTSCRGTGTFGGKVDSILKLFKAQIPEDNKEISRIDL